MTLCWSLTLMLNLKDAQHLYPLVYLLKQNFQTFFKNHVVSTKITLVLLFGHVKVFKICIYLFNVFVCFLKVLQNRLLQIYFLRFENLCHKTVILYLEPRKYCVLFKVNLKLFNIVKLGIMSLNAFSLMLKSHCEGWVMLFI